MTDSKTNSTPATDENLFREWRQYGDENALNELKARHGTRLEHYAVHRLYFHHCPIGISEGREIVGRVFDALASYHGGMSVQAWLYAVANMAVMERAQQAA